MDVAAKRMPARALGLTWAKVDPGDRDLDVALGVADEMRPRQADDHPGLDRQSSRRRPRPMSPSPRSTSASSTSPTSSRRRRTTGISASASSAWISAISTACSSTACRACPASLRSGGDGGPARLAAPPPTEKLVALLFRHRRRRRPTARRRVTFDMPDFNGTVRVMAMAWSKNGVGHATKDVIVRDPVVVTASLPRFLALGRHLAPPRRDQQRRRARRRLQTDGRRPRSRRRRRRPRPHRAAEGEGAGQLQPADRRVRSRRLQDHGEPRLADRRDLAEGTRPRRPAAGHAGDAAQSRRRQWRRHAHRRQGAARGIRAGHGLGRGLDRRRRAASTSPESSPPSTATPMAAPSS